MAGARHFKALICWQLADELKVRLYAVVERPHVRRDFRWVDQVVTSASSAPSNIAEGFGRWSNAERLHYFDISRASLNEIQNHLKDGLDLRHIDGLEYRELHMLSARALTALARFQSYLRRYESQRAGDPNERAKNRRWKPRRPSDAPRRPSDAPKRTKSQKSDRKEDLREGEGGKAGAGGGNRNDD
jgi:four helix bundle protein